MKTEEFWLDEMIRFYSQEKCKDILFCAKTYRMIGEDDVGNYIGVAETGGVFYLETGRQNIMYMAPSLDIWLQELELYKNYTKNSDLPWNPSEEELKKYAEGLKIQLENLDLLAVSQEDFFWSIILEQMETEQL